MRFDIDCMLGHKHKSKTKWGAKKMKHRCTPAHIFWSFLLHQVRRGELALEDILSDAMAALSGGGGDSGGNGENGGGGCGNSDVVGYTGNSPPVALSTVKSPQWQNWKTLLVSVLLVCGTAIMFMACKRECQYSGQTKEGYTLDEANCEWVKDPVEPIKKEDKILEYDFSEKCGGLTTGGENPPILDTIEKWKGMENTGNIIAKLFCKNGDVPQTIVDRRLENLKRLSDAGVKFVNPDTAYTTRDISLTSVEALAKQFKIILIKDLDYQY